MPLTPVESVARGTVVVAGRYVSAVINASTWPRFVAPVSAVAVATKTFVKVTDVLAFDPSYFMSSVPDALTVPGKFKVVLAFKPSDSMRSATAEAI